MSTISTTNAPNQTNFEADFNVHCTVRVAARALVSGRMCRSERGVVKPVHGEAIPVTV